MRPTEPTVGLRERIRERTDRAVPVQALVGLLMRWRGVAARRAKHARTQKAVSSYATGLWDCADELMETIKEKSNAHPHDERSDTVRNVVGTKSETVKELTDEDNDKGIARKQQRTT